MGGGGGVRRRWSNSLAEESPVLVAVDDVQWLDPSSRRYPRVRRAPAPRAGSESSSPSGVTPTGAPRTSWLRPRAARRRSTQIRLGPLSLGALSLAGLRRLERSLPRSIMVRIADISGGNPFYASSWRAAMRRRMAPFRPSPRCRAASPSWCGCGSVVSTSDVRDVLLAIACVPSPPPPWICWPALHGVTTTAERIVELLEGVESDGIVSIDGDRIRFSHPLLARGVYTDASPARRRAMHRALAAIVTQPNSRPATWPSRRPARDDATLTALDAAADSARARGAPAAAAELLDLAIGLGGDKPWRRIRAAGDHFQAGSTDHAEDLLVPIIDELRPGMLRAIALNLLAAIRIYDNNFVKRGRICSPAPSTMPRTCRTHPGPDADASVLHPGLWVPSPRHPAARACSTSRCATPEQAATSPRIRACPGCRARPLPTGCIAQFMHGYGVDDESLRPCAWNSSRSTMTSRFRFSASACEALILAYAGRTRRGQVADAGRPRTLPRARLRPQHDERCLLSGAHRAVERQLRRGRPLSPTMPSSAPNSSAAVPSTSSRCRIRAAVLAHVGREAEALADADAALTAAEACGSPRMAEWPLMTKGFMEVSLGRHAAALTTLEPLDERLRRRPRHRDHERAGTCRTPRRRWSPSTGSTTPSR